MCQIDHGLRPAARHGARIIGTVFAGVKTNNALFYRHFACRFALPRHLEYTLPSTSTNTGSRLVLASTSKYRRALLERLQLPFTVNGSLVDESHADDEDPTALVHRLSKAKAEAVSSRYPDGVVIGSDQVAVRGRILLGKPLTPDRCFEQLRDASGQRVTFYTGVHVIDLRGRRYEAHVDTTTVSFRTLSDAEIRNYIAKDQPFDCAGGFKVESLGISLFERIDSQDPTALMGLPLIWLSGALRRSGFELP